MKFYLISDNADTENGMRLAGIEGVSVYSAGEAEDAIDRACSDTEIAIILVTEKIMTLCPDKIYGLKRSSKRPLIAVIPDRHGGGNISETINRYISESIGVKL
ncbi:MAG: V-type ATP synthase subunit F [Oscillospiraceae bacterium]|nr:V-type ATP synthase subunit F [Oscillospiraceae bacterium]